MRTLVYSITALLLAFLSQAKEIAQEQHAHVSLSAAGMSRLNLDAKNTETIIEIWGKDQISVDAYFYYRGEEDHSEIKKFMASFEKNVKNGITTTGQEINLSTYCAVPSKRKVGWESSWASVIFVNEGFSEKEAKLVYKIKVPASLFLSIKHSYQNLEIKGKVNNVEIDQYSGRLSLDKVDYAKLNLKYGEASITNLTKADIDLYEQKISGSIWGNITLNAKYSKLRVRSIKKLVGQGYESKYRAIDLGMLSGNYKYSNFDIEHIESMDLLAYETQLESISIDQMKLTNSKYSNYTIASLGSLSIIESYEDEYSLRDVNKVSAANSKYCRFNIASLKKDYTLSSAYECRVDIAAISGVAGNIKIDGKYLNISLGLADLPYKLQANLQYGNLNYPNSLQGKFSQKNSRITASLSSPNLSKDFYLIELSGYEVQANLE